MPVAEEIELEAPAPEEPVAPEELASLADWHWEMRVLPEASPEQDWFWSEEELRRLRLAAGYEPEDV